MSDAPDNPKIHLCVEKSGTEFESVTNFSVPGPDYFPNPSSRMWLDWSAAMIIAGTDRPTSVKLTVISAYADVHDIEVERIPSEEFYARFPEVDPRRSNVR